MTKGFIGKQSNKFVCYQQ